MAVEIVEGDLLDQAVDAIVNPWNRNVIPWWLLLPQGVSGALKRRAGVAPFRELATLGPIPLGGAVLTSAGRLPFRGIVHVAGIDLLWRASARSIQDSVRNTLDLAEQHAFRSVAFPVVGAGSGGFDEARAAELICEEIERSPRELLVVLVRRTRPHSTRPLSVTVTHGGAMRKQRMTTAKLIEGLRALGKHRRRDALPLLGGAVVLACATAWVLTTATPVEETIATARSTAATREVTHAMLHTQIWYAYDMAVLTAKLERLVFMLMGSVVLMLIAGLARLVPSSNDVLVELWDRVVALETKAADEHERA